MFKRRRPLTYIESFARLFWPKGGWGRAARYVIHRLRRLPDPAYKISRGIAAGVFVCFTPFFGFHFIVSAGIAWAIRGNILAALLATFFGNPLTFPLIGALAMEIGTWILGQPGVPLPKMFAAFSNASVELWRNFVAIFTADKTQWASLSDFWQRVFWPYLLGGLAPGIAAGVASYVLSRPLIAAYQKARVARLKKKFEKKREAVRSRQLSRQVE